ncbi:MAG: CMP deaminase [Candidatus Liptonbacteria bacterium]|nr:CMP deaminase [Candidatus Liptonbacteria bacterium]
MEANTRDLLYFAYVEAAKSRDPSTQNGALLYRPDYGVLIADHNRFPTHVNADVPERWERPLKYEYIEHAERNVIFSAAKYGISTRDLIMICPWAPCADCARAIIQSGIIRLIAHKQAHDRSPDRWKEQINRALNMLCEARVEVTHYDDKISGVTIRHNGELWEP